MMASSRGVARAIPAFGRDADTLQRYVARIVVSPSCRPAHPAPIGSPRAGRRLLGPQAHMLGAWPQATSTMTHKDTP